MFPAKVSFFIIIKKKWIAYKKGYFTFVLRNGNILLNAFKDRTNDRDICPVICYTFIYKVHHMERLHEHVIFYKRRKVDNETAV
jgi:hypothetical protein